MLDRRHERALPAIPGTQASQQMMDAVVEAARELLPEELRLKFIRTSRLKYAGKMEAWARGAETAHAS
jgi:hypothetical protein